jgi:hypothetical protein
VFSAAMAAEMAKVTAQYRKRVASAMTALRALVTAMALKQRA